MKTTEKERKIPMKKIGFRHLQVFLLFSGMAIAYTLRASLSIAIIAMTSKNTSNPNILVFDWNSKMQSTILSSFFWGYVVSQVPAGQIASTGSASKLLAYGIFLSSSINALIPFLANFGYIPVVCCRVLMGFAQGCLMPCNQTLLSRWVPSQERSRLGSFVINGSQLGIIIALPSAGLIASNVNWPSIFYVFGGIGIAWSILFYFISVDHPSQHPRISPVELCYINNGIGNPNKSELVKVPWKSLITSLPTWSLIITHSGYCWGFYTFLTYLPSYMKSVLNFDIAESGIFSTLPYVAMWLICFPISYISDLSIKKGISTELARKICNTIGLWIPAMAMIALCLIKTQNKVILVSFIIIAVGFQSGCAAGFQINHIDLSPNFAGPMMSLTNGIGNTFGILAPIACGWIVTNQENSAQWDMVFYISAGIFLASNTIFIIFGKAELQSWNQPVQPKNKEKNRVSMVVLGEQGVLVISDESKINEVES